MKIAYFGFDLFVDCLKTIIDNGHDVVKIFTCKVDGDYENNTKTYAVANSNSIDITDEKVTGEMIYELENVGCDIMVSAGYYYKIPISKKIMGVNIHPALLPVGKGPWPQPITILRNIKDSGITLHKLTDSFDSGEIVLQQSIKVDDKENLETLTTKMQIAAPKLIAKFLKSPKQLWDKSVAQTSGEYWKEPNKEDMTFSLTDSFEKIDRITRAFYGYRCYLQTDGECIVIKEAVCVTNSTILKNVEYIDTFKINGGVLVLLKLS